MKGNKATKVLFFSSYLSILTAYTLFICSLMRFKLLTFSIALSLATFAQVSIKDISFDKTTINLGKIYAEDGIVNAQYTLTNNSTNELVINNIDVACGCTNPKASLYQVPAGATSIISVEFNPAGMVGDVTKWLYVQANFTNAIQQRLELKATIRSLRLQRTQDHYPGEFGYLLLSKMNLNAGTLLGNATKTDSIIVGNDGYNPITISKVEDVPDFITFTNVPLTVNPGDTLYLRATYSSENIDTVGFWSGDLKLITDDRFFPKKSISFYGEFKPDFNQLSRRQLKKSPKISFSSSTIDMGTMKSGQLRKKTLTITNTGKRPLLLRRIETDCTCAVINNPPTSIEPGGSAEVEVQFDALYKQGRQMKAITIYTNDPINSEATVTVKAMVQ
jgi:hypothetical protein